VVNLVEYAQAGVPEHWSIGNGDQPVAHLHTLDTNAATGHFGHRTTPPDELLAGEAPRLA
jgi:hypothetical protein